jgi:hypothetical protein
MSAVKSVVRMNAEKDPTYRPYCMRCDGLVRMQIVEPLLWKCHCGAIHDEREELLAPESSGIRSVEGAPPSKFEDFEKLVDALVVARADEIHADKVGTISQRAKASLKFELARKKVYAAVSRLITERAELSGLHQHWRATAENLAGENQKNLTALSTSESRVSAMQKVVDAARRMIPDGPYTSAGSNPPLAQLHGALIALDRAASLSPSTKND